MGISRAIGISSISIAGLSKLGIKSTVSILNNSTLTLSSSISIFFSGM